MSSRARALAATMATSALIGGCGDAPDATPPPVAETTRVNILGQVRADTELPRDASLEIRLHRASFDNLDAATVAMTTLTADGGAPYDFSLVYEPARLDADLRYAVSARARDSQGRVTHISTGTVALPGPQADPRITLTLRPDTGRAPAAAPAATYNCDGRQITVHFDTAGAQHAVRITGLGATPLRLPAQRAASGARYSDNDTTFWNKTGEARLEYGGEVYRCMPSPPAG